MYDIIRYTTIIKTKEVYQMQTKERRLIEAEIILLWDKLTDESKQELFYFAQWITANHPTDDELTAEIERRKQVIGK
ncbi:hypothetical protein EOM82_08230 [bacterium]|nr:hypothetical protein [bacterium]